MSINDLKFDSQGLIPVVTQDAFSGEVLMQAYMSADSLRLTIESGFAHYFSRSRQKLWKKGEESGHLQRVIAILSDCDNDSLLMRVEQVGHVACHTGARSCFFNKVFEAEQVDNSVVLYDCIRTIKDRKRNRVDGSYTNYLFDKGTDKICKKIGEESSEVIIAATKKDSKEMANELADLFFHVLVLLEATDVPIEKVFEVLSERAHTERKRNY